MVLLRAAFTKIFPHLDKILNIDNDTVVKNNISELWDIDLTDYYLAGCGEPKQSKNNFTYINMGVAMINLKKLREDGVEEKFINYIKTLKQRNLRYNDQDALNAVCYGKIKPLSPECNAMQHFVITDENKPILEQCYRPKDWEKAQNDPSIIHYAGRKKPWKNQYTSRYSDWEIYSKILEEKTGKKYVP